ncbi:MAG: hypothetical protein EA417_09460 [Gammaproteobacteria bacterium]|nr:MAG: hypothetical protein EA417_09460 [Gammaproteobacteria bacterium]
MKRVCGLLSSCRRFLHLGAGAEDSTD